MNQWRHLNQSMMYTLYQKKVTFVEIRSIEAEDQLCKVPNQKGNEIQHMKLRHCSYITQPKLQHILLAANYLIIDLKTFYSLVLPGSRERSSRIPYKHLCQWGLFHNYSQMCLIRLWMIRLYTNPTGIHYSWLARPQKEAYITNLHGRKWSSQLYECSF